MARHPGHLDATRTPAQIEAWFEDYASHLPLQLGARIDIDSDTRVDFGDLGEQLRRLTGEARYAGKAVRILNRLAACYRNWLYHDYWDAVADCDPSSAP